MIVFLTRDTIFFLIHLSCFKRSIKKSLKYQTDIIDFMFIIFSYYRFSGSLSKNKRSYDSGPLAIKALTSLIFFLIVFKDSRGIL